MFTVVYHARSLSSFQQVPTIVPEAMRVICIQAVSSCIYIILYRFPSNAAMHATASSTGVSVVPGLGRLIANPELLASIRAIVGTVTSAHLAENLLRGDLDENLLVGHFLELADFRGMIFVRFCGHSIIGSAAKIISQHVINERERRGKNCNKLKSEL